MGQTEFVPGIFQDSEELARFSDLNKNQVQIKAIGAELRSQRTELRYRYRKV